MEENEKTRERMSAHERRMADVCRSRLLECPTCVRRAPADDNNSRGGGGGGSHRGGLPPPPPGPTFGASPFYAEMFKHFGDPTLALTQAPGPAPAQVPAPTSAPITSATGTAPAPVPAPTSAPASATGAAHAQDPAATSAPASAADQERIRQLTQELAALKRAQRPDAASGTAARRGRSGRRVPLRGQEPHLEAGTTNRFLFDSMVHLMPGFVRCTAKARVREAVADAADSAQDIFRSASAKVAVKTAKSRLTAAVKRFGRAPVDEYPHGTKPRLKPRLVPSKLDPTDLRRRIKIARRTNPNAQHERQELKTVDATFALCDVAFTRASQVGLRQPAARAEAIAASTKEQRDLIHGVISEKAKVAKVAGDDDEDEEDDDGEGDEGDDHEGDEDEGDDDEDQGDDTAAAKTKGHARKQTPAPGRHLEGIGMLRGLYFVTLLRSLPPRRRVANHASRIAAECANIAHTTLLNVESNEQHDLTSLVPQLLQDVYELMTIKSTWTHTDHKASLIRSALMAAADTAHNPDGDTPRPWASTPERRRRLAFADSRVLFWACVVLGGCSPENAAAWETMTKDTPFNPTPATHIWSKHLKLVHIPGPPPQVWTSTRYFATSTFYDTTSTAAGEDNDGLFIPPGATAPPWLDTFHKMYNKRGPFTEARDFGYDGVEKAGRGDLPVRTANSMRAATTARRAAPAAGKCAACGLDPSGGDPRMLGLDICIDRARCAAQEAAIKENTENTEENTENTEVGEVPEPSLLQEYLALATPAADANIYDRGVELKRNIQRCNPLTQLEPAGADSRGRPVCHVSFAAEYWPWRTRSNAVAQLVHGYAYPSLLSTGEVKRWEAQYCGIVYYQPSVYVPSKVLRELHEQAFLYGLKDASIRDRRTGRGLFAVYDAAPNRRPRELPLLPSWWRQHKRDTELIKGHEKFKERGDPAATPTSCIWHLWTPTKAARGRSRTQPPPCGVTCADLGELYSHRCLSRRAAGGDVYMLLAQIGISMEKGHVERASEGEAKAAGLAPPVVHPSRWWSREMWDIWGPLFARGGSGGGSGVRHNNTPLAAGVGRRTTTTQDPNVSIEDAANTSDENDDHLAREDSPCPTPRERQPPAQPSQEGPPRNKRGREEKVVYGRTNDMQRQRAAMRASQADLDHLFRNA